MIFKLTRIFTLLITTLVLTTSAFAGVKAFAFVPGEAGGGGDVYYVYNTTGYNVGTVTLNCVDGSHYNLAVDSTYSHHTTVTAQVNSITTNGATITYPNHGPVVSAFGHSVGYTFGYGSGWGGFKQHGKEGI